MGVGFLFFIHRTMPAKRERKEEYCDKLRELLNKYNKIMIVGADNVGSSHMQSIRASIRGKGVLLMGKNTMIRRVIRTEYKKFEPLLGVLEGNVGLLFTDSDLSELRDVIKEQKVAAPAKAGALSPCDVVIPAGDTGLEPTQTAFLQALNIATRINKGQIAIQNDILLLTEGEKVGASQATLLQKLKIKPFSYGLLLRSIFEDGHLYVPMFLTSTWPASPSSSNPLLPVLPVFLWLLVTLLVLPSLTLWLVVSRTSCLWLSLPISSSSVLRR